jgi:shikimate 5-dehydrogenase
LSVGVIGNGGAARGAARALLDAGSRVTIYYRNVAKGPPVAAALGAESLPLGELARGRHGLLVNATPLGLHTGDPSPVPASVFEAAGVAFDMVYDPPETAFLAAARAAGAATIPGREMLIAQAVVQFRLFTGAEASHEEFAGNFSEAIRRRREPESVT